MDEMDNLNPINMPVDYPVMRYHPDGRYKTADNPAMYRQIYDEGYVLGAPAPKPEPPAPKPEFNAEVAFDEAMKQLDEHANQIKLLIDANRELVRNNAELNELVADLAVKLDHPKIKKLLGATD